MQDCSSVCCGVDACLVKKKEHHKIGPLTHQTLLARSFFFLPIMDGSFLNKTTLATASFVQWLQFCRWDSLVVVWIFACLLTFVSSHTGRETQRQRGRERERKGVGLLFGLPSPKLLDLEGDSYAHFCPLQYNIWKRNGRRTHKRPYKSMAK